MESHTNLTSNVNFTRLLITPNLTISKRQWRTGKYAIAVCVLTVLAVLIFVAVGSIILFNTMKEDKNEVNTSNFDKINSTTQNTLIPAPGKIDAEHSTAKPGRTSQPELTRTQTLKFCQATSITSFTSHSKKFLILAEKQTNMVKVLQFSEAKQEFITVQIIIIHRPIELKYLPELFSPQNNNLLMVVSEREVTFYKWVDRMRVFMLESEEVMAELRTGNKEKRSVGMLPSGKKVECVVDENKNMRVFSGRRDFTKTFIDRIGEIRKFGKNGKINTKKNRINTSNVESCEFYDRPGGKSVMISLHTKLEKVRYKKTGKVLMVRRSRVIFTEFSDLKPIRIKQVGLLRVPNWTSVVSLVQGGEFFVSSLGDRSDSKSRCYVGKMRF